MALPSVGAGLERGDRGDVGLWRIVLEILSEKRGQDLLPEMQRGVAAELDMAPAAAPPLPIIWP